MRVACLDDVKGNHVLVLPLRRATRRQARRHAVQCAGRSARARGWTAAPWASAGDQGQVDIDRRVIGCHLGSTITMRWMTGPDRHCSPCHRMPCNASNEG